jgi:hypothetical protein
VDDEAARLKAIKRLRARADRVNHTCNLGDLLRSYGYAVVSDPHREQQFSCDLHGVDRKPSARYYPSTNSTWCWVCRKSRDPIAYVMEKEGVGFREAVEHLEQRLGLGALPWVDAEDRPADVHDEIDVARSVSYEDERRRTDRLLRGLTHDREPDARTILAFWETFDRVDYGVSKESWGELKGVQALVRLREKVLDVKGMS